MGAGRQSRAGAPRGSHCRSRSGCPARRTPRTGSRVRAGTSSTPARDTSGVARCLEPEPPSQHARRVVPAKTQAPSKEPPSRDPSVFEHRCAIHRCAAGAGSPVRFEPRRRPAGPRRGSNRARLLLDLVPSPLDRSHGPAARPGRTRDARRRQAGAKSLREQTTRFRPGVVPHAAWGTGDAHMTFPKLRHGIRGASRTGFGNQPRRVMPAWTRRRADRRDRRAARA